MGVYMKKIMILAMIFCMLTITACAQKRTGEKVNLVWQPTFTNEDNLAIQPKLVGVNVVSPCWLTIKSKDGMIQESIDKDYIEKCQGKGYKVWPLITNNFDRELTHAFLHNEAARKYIIEQLILYAQKNKFDGYNFDFENIYAQDKDALTSFIKELSDALHQEKLTLSMDVTVPSNDANWSKGYNRGELAKYLDYIVLMAYDEHGRLSKKSGSVASINWVEQGIKNTLSEGVPDNKLILGVPLYMRIWSEHNNIVEAKTLSMPKAQEILQEKYIKPQWQEKNGQFYFEYRDMNLIKKRVWQEDAASLKLKAALINKYNLAGIASWRKGFETPDIWKTLDSVVNKR